MRELGVALGTAVMTAVFVGAGGALVPGEYVAAARPAVLLGAAVLGVATLAALLLPAGRSESSASMDAVDGVDEVDGVDREVSVPAAVG
ncbi:hypothetical protein [Microbacterium kunmingense]|uniref:hypothetical protein n=1 Tax=Microbacterium kunmingense TaxID=2915939 RepID=UPI003D74F320